MIETFDQIYEAFKSQMTREQFDKVVRQVYYQVYSKQLLDFQTAEDKILVKITLIQLLKQNSLICLLEEDLLPLINDSLAIENDSSLYDKYRCSKCQKVMPQAYQASCGCNLCRKCIQRQHYVKDKTCPTCIKPITSFTQLKELESFVRMQTFLCPFCHGKFTFKSIQSHMNTCTDRITIFKAANSDLILNQIQDKYNFQMKLSGLFDYFLNQGNSYSAFYETVDALFMGKNVDSSSCKSCAILFDKIMSLYRMPEYDSKINVDDEVEYYKIKTKTLIWILKLSKGANVMKMFKKETKDAKLEEYKQLLQYKLKTELDVEDCIDQLMSENEKHEKKIAELEYQIMSQTRRMSMKSEIIEEVDNVKFQEMITEKQNQIDILTDQVKQLQEQMHLKDQAVQDMKSVFNDSSSKYSEVEAQLNQEKQNHNQTKLQFQQLTEQFQQQNQLIQKQIQQIDNFQTVSTEQTKLIADLKFTLEDTQKQSGDVPNLLKYKKICCEFPLQLQKIVVSFNQQIDQIGIKQTKVQQKLAFIQQMQFSNLTKMVSQHKSQFNSHVEEILQQKKLILELQTNQATFQAQVGEQKKAQTEQLQRNLQLVQQVTELKQDVKTLTQEKLTLKQQFDVSLQDFATQKQLLTEKDSQLLQLKENFFFKEKDLEKQIAALTQQLSFQENQNLQQKTKLESVEAQLQKTSLQYQLMGEQFNLSQNTVTNLKLDLIQTYKQLINSQQNTTPQGMNKFLERSFQKDKLGTKTKQLQELYSQAMSIDEELENVRAIFYEKDK